MKNMYNDIDRPVVAETFIPLSVWNAVGVSIGQRLETFAFHGRQLADNVSERAKTLAGLAAEREAKERAFEQPRTNNKLPTKDPHNYYIYSCKRNIPLSNRNLSFFLIISQKNPFVKQKTMK